MRYPLLTLDDMLVASPCSVPWDSMSGDGRVRYCSQCDQHVYNLSGMTVEQATELVRDNDWQLCVRFYRRWDGTVMTADCPAGLVRLGKSYGWLTGAAAAMLALGLSLMLLMVSGFLVRNPFVTQGKPCPPSLRPQVAPAGQDK
jgi:hypothetical protein